MSNLPDIFEMPNAKYLRNLAERLREVPVTYGVNGADIDRLEELAGDIERDMHNERD